MPRSGDLYYSVHPFDNEPLPALVLVHGAGGRGDQWPYQMRRLPNRRVYALDLPAHGLSDGTSQTNMEGYAANLLQWMDAVELQQTTIAGHSMGAAIALQVALAAPERVESLILLACADRFMVNPILLEKLSVPAWQERAVKMIVTWSFAQKASNRLRQVYSADLMTNRPGVLLADFSVCSKFTIDEQLKMISRPALVMSGAEDVMVPLSRSRLLADKLVRGTFKTIPGCGHMLHLEQPRDVANAILRFLEQRARYD